MTILFSHEYIPFTLIVLAVSFLTFILLYGRAWGPIDNSDDE